MFLLDDILLSPARGLLAVFRNLHDAAQEEYVHEAEAIRTQLSEMYLLLETGQLSEEEFDCRERELLDRLEKVEARGETDNEEQDEEEDEDLDDETEDDEEDDVAEDDEEADEDSRFDAHRRRAR
jgi:hypothetical protein